MTSSALQTLADASGRAMLDPYDWSYDKPCWSFDCLEPLRFRHAGRTARTLRPASRRPLLPERTRPTDQLQPLPRAAGTGTTGRHGDSSSRTSRPAGGVLTGSGAPCLARPERPALAHGGARRTARLGARTAGRPHRARVDLRVDRQGRRATRQRHRPDGRRQRGAAGTVAAGTAGCPGARPRTQHRPLRAGGPPLSDTIGQQLRRRCARLPSDLGQGERR